MTIQEMFKQIPHEDIVGTRSADSPVNIASRPAIISIRFGMTGRRRRIIELVNIIRVRIPEDGRPDVANWASVKGLGWNKSNFSAQPKKFYSPITDFLVRDVRPLI